MLDAVVVGAGISGIYQLYRLRQAGLSVQLCEAGAGVGGTWFWNRYPGARFDSESYSYGYFFSPELLEEWTWSEEFAGQPETERYLNHVVDRFDLRRDIRLGARVGSAVYDDAAAAWTVTVENGERLRARFLVTAVGPLSEPYVPAIPGLADFAGVWHHTARWPHEPVELRGKRVAVIGTGSSGVQVIPHVAAEAAELVVFQRTANWCTPINNRPITPERMREIRRTARSIHRTCRETPGGFVHRPLPVSALEVGEEERREQFQRLYDAPGLTMVLANYRDISSDRAANAAVTDFLRDKIRERVKDPEVAERLIPTDHTFGMKRPPLEDGFYEVFAQEHVSLVPLAQEPILRFTPGGIQTAARHYDIDVAILATGFDAVTGAIRRIDVRGRDGVRLDRHWEAGPRTHLGLQSAGFPNLFFVGGPQSTTGNIPRATEIQVDWVMDCLGHMADRGYRRVETTPAAEEAWLAHVESTVRGTVLEDATSWAFGSNVPGKPRVYQLYAGGIPQYRARCEEEAEAGYASFVFG
ncbi:flavin-containing monooxygenase [Phytohabitans suffuscus]|uniref:Steroid monooxygenase n=1 Tax=Phytohabitans suffuscus TaxID=624315 RepID=A0A6F8YUK0_9ACTN|nr:NAD(P)/FAD-dependent oxidoreductase [Phytohabitans suffuscus]BCB89855.1 steroid monooxygenase [Phytohabitans suffuscus]